MTDFDGIVLAGGEASRLGGVSKPQLVVGGSDLLAIAVLALHAAQATVVVGPALETPLPVTWVREDPPGGGPVAALAAALPLIASPVVVVLAADLPFVTPDAVERLLVARNDAAAAMAIDADARDQPLLACYETAALRSAMPAEPAGTSLRALLLTLARIATVRRIDLGGSPPVTWDCDTSADVDRARGLI